jgi:proteasome alpha subunit
MTARTSTPKLFEIYDHLALGTAGHPADIEKVRQTAIDAAHLEGFARSPKDVTARRLVSYNLAPALKAAFEQIFAAPLLFRGVLCELGATPAEDNLWRVDYDGSFSAQAGPELAHGIVISGPRQVSKEWIAQSPKPELERNNLKAAAYSALRLLVWAKLRGTKDQGIEFSAVPTEVSALKEKLGAEGLEFALLDRSLLGQPIMYRVPTAEELGL